MLRQTFLAAPRLEGIQEEDDHSGTDSNSTQNLKKNPPKFSTKFHPKISKTFPRITPNISKKFTSKISIFFIKKYQYLKIIIMVK